MFYAILCYHSEAAAGSWTRERDDAVLANLATARRELAERSRIGPVARLMPTTTALTLRQDRRPPVVVDGPFAETKEQLLGLYIVECADLEQALEAARALSRASSGGVYEVRPVAWLQAADGAP
jgi:hypothetical protein